MIDFTIFLIAEVLRKARIRAAAEGTTIEVKVSEFLTLFASGETSENSVKSTDQQAAVLNQVQTRNSNK